MQKKSTLRFRLRLLVAGLFLIGAVILQFQTGMVAFAAAKVWDGSAGDGVFSTAANWADNSVPNDGDSLIFDVTGLSGNVTLNNDIVGLEVSGITITGVNSLFNYIFNGNELGISGAIEEDTTGTHQGAFAQFNLDLSLTGDTSLHSVRIAPTSTITTNGNALSLSSDSAISCGAVTIAGDLIGNGAVTVTSGTAMIGGDLSSTTHAYDGSIFISDGAGLIVDTDQLSTFGSVTTSAGGHLQILLGLADQTVDTPITFGGELTVDAGSIAWNGCSGDSSMVMRTLTLTGVTSMVADATYRGILADTDVTGGFDSNGYSFTNDPSHDGVITVPSDTVPTVPLNLQGTPSNSQIALEWDAPAEDGGPSITDYIVQYKLSSSGTWVTFSDGTSTTTSASVTGLGNGNNYDFRVAAVNSVGTGSYATITGVAVTSGATAPDAPTSLVSSIEQGTNNLVLTWSAPASDGGAPITDYLIEIKESSSMVWSTVSHSPFTGNSFEISSGLTNGFTYDIRVSAINSEGTSSPVTITNVAYSLSNGVAPGTSGSFSGEGSGQTPGAPNTGLLRLQINNPIFVILMGAVAALVLVFIAWPRRTN